jgi:NitT/TauT family transport system permease protein
LIVFGDWEIIGRNINTLIFAPPSEVLKQFNELLASGELAISAKVTMPALFVGYPLAAVVGVSSDIITGEIFLNIDGGAAFALRPMPEPLRKDLI